MLSKLKIITDKVGDIVRILKAVIAAFEAFQDSLRNNPKQSNNEIIRPYDYAKEHEQII
jgi:hypothetical protein